MAPSHLPTSTNTKITSNTKTNFFKHKYKFAQIQIQKLKLNKYANVPSERSLWHPATCQHAQIQRLLKHTNTKLFICLVFFFIFVFEQFCICVFHINVDTNPSDHDRSTRHWTMSQMYLGKCTLTNSVQMYLGKF